MDSGWFENYFVWNDFRIFIAIGFGVFWLVCPVICASVSFLLSVICVSVSVLLYVSGKLESGATVNVRRDLSDLAEFFFQRPNNRTFVKSW